MIRFIFVVIRVGIVANYLEQGGWGVGRPVVGQVGQLPAHGGGPPDHEHQRGLRDAPGPGTQGPLPVGAVSVLRLGSVLIRGDFSFCSRLNPCVSCCAVGPHTDTNTSTQRTRRW